MSYLYKLLPDGHRAETNDDQLVNAIREVEIQGDPTELISLTFKSEALAPLSSVARREDWRDLPRGERTKLYITEGNEVFTPTKSKTPPLDAKNVCIAKSASATA